MRHVISGLMRGIVKLVMLPVLVLLLVLRCLPQMVIHLGSLCMGVFSLIITVGAYGILIAAGFIDSMIDGLLGWIVG